MALMILEIGTEEIPAAFAELQEKSLAEQIADTLEKQALRYGKIETSSTPRRLVLKIDEISPFQDKKSEIILGPAVKAAWDEHGAPTKALEGFCRAQNVSPKEVITTKTPKGEYAAVKKKTGGKPAKEVLEEILPEIIANLPFPKKMRWSGHELNYARPIHWILALLDGETIPFSFGHLKAGNITYGHRVHGKGPFAVKSAQDYENVIREDCQITLNAEIRKSMIRQKGNELAAKTNGRIVWKESLLDEVAGLVEHPFPLLGSYSEKYLQIPEEVLLTSMEKHQKCFGIRNENGKLAPCFLTVVNLTPGDENTVRKGWERVLKARLEDAVFFWEEDSKTPLSHWLAKLEKVIFIGSLGSMADKSRRVSQLCAWLAEKTGLASPQDAKRAGELSKMDLVSGMVGEFDTLQGIMGGIYAKKAGENEAVAKALQEQYLPAGPDTPTPQTSLGALLALADRADTLVGCFGLGKIPTGAADPDGLRRASLGMIRIMLDKEIELPMQEIFAKALALYGERHWKFTQKEILEKLHDFMAARLRNWLGRMAYDGLVVDAVLDRPFATPFEAEMKIRALQEFCTSGEAEAVSTICKRVENIVKKADSGQAGWKTELLEEESEKELAAILDELLPTLDAELSAKNYAKALAKLTTLKKPLDEFFENTMIMCEDRNLRNNRLALLGAILERLGRIASFAKLQI